MQNIDVIELAMPKELGFLSPLILVDLIRMGTLNDGGYVLPKRCIQKSDFLLSFGLNDDWNFEKDYRQRMPDVGIQVYDHSVDEAELKKRSVNILKRVLSGSLSRLSRFFKQWQIYKDYSQFFAGAVVHHKEKIVDDSSQETGCTVSEAIIRTKARDIFLKMDIEGGEYAVIKELLPFRDQIVGKAIEFHDTDQKKAEFIELMADVLKFYALVHVHGNNYGHTGTDGLPVSLELSFARNDLVSCELQENKRRTRSLVRHLDAPCNPDLPDYDLVFSA